MQFHVNRTLMMAFASLLALGISYSHTLADNTGVLPEENVLSYLEQLIEWQRDVMVLEPATGGPRELMFQQTVQQNGMRGLRAGFKFARAQASIAPAETIDPDATNNPQQKIQEHAAEIDRRITQLRAKIQEKLSPTQRQQTESQLKLALPEQALLETIQANLNAAASGNGASFNAKISNLQRGVPALLDDTAKPSPAKTAEDAASTPAVATSLLGLSSELFSIARKQRELEAFSEETAQVDKAGHAMLKTLRDALDTLHALNNEHTTVDERVESLKQLITVLAPLAEANVWTGSSITALNDWDQTLSKQFAVALRQFAIRLAFLLLMLAIPLVGGEVAQRMIDRYVSDVKRRRQVHTARRIVVTIAVVFILLLHFISDFGSFATFAGFLTAGLAVALQGVLLSLVAHFFFYGRYGVRTGDRVNVAGVTGDLVQIGMMRFYLRELTTAADGTLVPTGKIVAFPNSILFQPTAFYKYV